MKILSIFMVCILITITYSIVEGESSSIDVNGVVNLNNVPEKYFDLYYLPTREKAKELLYKEVGENPVLWEALYLDFYSYGPEWQGFVYYYSIENQQFMVSIITVPIIGDDISIAGGAEVFISETACSQFENHIKISNATREWEFEYGPVFNWSVETNYLFYEKYKCTPLMPDHLFSRPKWSLPNENNRVEDALFRVHDMILKQYHFDVEKQDHIHEYIEYLGNPDHGQWKISYWIKVKKGEEIFWTTLMIYQQDDSGTFYQVDGLTEPTYMDFFIR